MKVVQKVQEEWPLVVTAAVSVVTEAKLNSSFKKKFLNFLQTVLPSRRDIVLKPEEVVDLQLIFNVLKSRWKRVRSRE